MNLNNVNYKENLKGISVVEVSGESCANCLTLMPILHELLKVYPDVNHHHLEVNEENIDLVHTFDIDRVPTILVMFNEKIEARCTGYQPEEILEIWLEDKINSIKIREKMF